MGSYFTAKYTLSVSRQQNPDIRFVEKVTRTDLTESPRKSRLRTWQPLRVCTLVRARNFTGERNPSLT